MIDTAAGVGIAPSAAAPRRDVKSLQSEDFFKLLITELQQQDPLEPSKTEDMIGQVDAVICANGTVLLRAERDGSGDGRVYRIHFTASDLEGSSAGVVTVTVPHSKRSIAVDSGMAYDSTR